MLYSPLKPQTEGDCGCNDKSEMPQCNLRPPFIDLEEGGAPKIDYDLRGHTCIEAVGIIPIKLDKSKLKPSAYASPAVTHYGVIIAASDQLLKLDFLYFLQGKPSDYNLILGLDAIG